MEEEKLFQKARRLVETRNLAGLSNFRGAVSGWHVGVTGVLVRGCSPGVYGDKDVDRCKLDGKIPAPAGKHVASGGDSWSLCDLAR